MADATIRFFPVGNGDCTLLWVGQTRILIDLSPRIKVGDPHFDLEETKEALLPLLEREDGNYVADAFILSHPDKDHLLYAEDLLHLGVPGGYDPLTKKIFIEEICYAPASFEAVKDPMSADARAVGEEIERRLSSNNSAGNLVSAFLEPDGDDPGADRTFSPGDVIDSFGASGSDERLSAVVYGPRGVLDPQNRNEVSAIVQMRVAPEGSDTPVRIILGGDAPWEVWKDIAETEDLEAFTYDLLLAPHHCSWTTFADQGADVASEEVIDLFGHAQAEAKVVASCFAIDSDRNPPSEEAAKIYRDLVGKENFFCTGQYPSKEEHRPIVFEITGTGVQRTDPEDRDATGGVAATVGAIRRTPQRYGCDR